MGETMPCASFHPHRSPSGWTGSLDPHLQSQALEYLKDSSPQDSDELQYSCEPLEDLRLLFMKKLEEEEVTEATFCERLDDLLQQSDFVMLAVRLTPQTQGLMGKQELQLMMLSAVLVNISRGLLVDQDALVEALQTGVIKAAALDVTYPEPLPRQNWCEGTTGPPIASPVSEGVFPRKLKPECEVREAKQLSKAVLKYCPPELILCRS
ncbi:uncharacterized protein [Castor canadensis]|uniref:Uncharacterized protein n=1 Tax=Castor canadensis TaxID=51338 RepID=A0AC58M8F9_CASCN